MAPGKPGLELKPIYTKNRTVGLLGGSFNPAHEGHLALSLAALKALKLDAVWWLVAPQNQLKKASSLAPYAKRFQSAKKMANHPHIFVSDIERQEKTFFSVDSIAMLKRRFPGTHFIWLMGADNLAELHRWRQWRRFCAAVPIAVFDRVPYSHSAERSKTYLAMKRFLLKNNAITAPIAAPGLAFIRMKRNPLSSTLLRKHLEKGHI